MTTYSADDLRQLLDLHRRWLLGEDGGQRAYLSGANLSGADLSDQPLRYASCSWTAHGECGRALTGIAMPDESGALRLRLSCGCFRGTADELREYIARGDERYRASRTTALQFILLRMAEMGVES